MGLVSKRESHVLKLVHPGGFVELHTKPVMASQVMSKNPRHYVTRPDIFKFPWIVVSPESVLTPGSVFFIVPCHTIRCLIKNPTTTDHTASLKQHHSHEPHADHQGCYRARKISNSKKIPCFRDHSLVSSTPSTMSCMKLGTTPREAQKQNKNKAGNKAQSLGRERPAECSSDYYSSREHAAAKVRAISKSRGSLCYCDPKGPKLKPCLKKDNMISHNERSRNLKVRFEDEHVNNTTFTTEEARDS